jgi:hypothetical protein
MRLVDNMNGILNEYMNQIYDSTDLEDCRKLFLTIVENSTIRAEDRRKMIIYAKQCDTLIKLQTMATNAFLKYNKLGVIKSSR